MSAMMKGFLPKIAISLCLLMLSGTGCAELDRIFGQPYVTITSPVNGEIVQGNAVTVEGTAEDGVAVVRLVYQLQNSEGRSAEIDIFNSYSPTAQTFAFEVADLQPGTNTITVVAFDGDAYRNQASVSITVEDEGAQPFEISFTSPTADFTTIDSEVEITGSLLVIDSSGSIVPDDYVGALDSFSYELSNSDGKSDPVDVLKDYDATTGDFAFTATDLTLGRNTITLTAVDEAGRTVEADITVTVEAPTPISLNVTAPSGTEPVIFGTKLAILGDLGGNIPVASLTYSLDEATPVDIFASVTEDRQFKTIIADLASGTYSVALTARDAQENEAKSSVSVKVVADAAPVALKVDALSETTLPEGTLTLPISGLIGTAQNIAGLRYHFGDPTQSLPVAPEAITTDTAATDPTFPQNLKFSFDADLASAKAGLVTLTLIAADAADNEISADITFTLEGEVTAPICGDDVISGDETCDTSQLNGSTCVDFGFGAGTLACSTSCALDTTPCTGSSYIRVAVGRDALCGLLGDGKITCSGFDQAPRNGQFSALGLGGAGLCAVRADSTLSCYGSNLNTPPDELFASVAVSNNDVCGLTPEGAVLCWPAFTSDSSTPFTNPSASPLASVWTAADGSSFCGLDAAGKAECWNRNGALFAPADLTFQAVRVAADRACGLVADGTLSCWNGETLIESGAPEGETFNAFGLGSAHTCALRTDGLASCWGDNSVRQLQAPTDLTFKAISVTGDNTCAIDTLDGLIKCWGPAADGGLFPATK